MKRVASTHRTVRWALGALSLALLGAAAASAAPPPPIPHDPLGGPSLVPDFEGQPATPRRVPAPRVPQHPFMAQNGRSNVHNDAYQTDTYTGPGPLGRSLRVSSQFFGTLGTCGITIAFDRRGRLVTICISGTAVELRLLDPDTLETLATHDLPPRVIPPGVSPFQAGGGAYFYLDNRDRAVVSVARHIFVIALKSGRWVRVRDYDLSSVVPEGDILNSALPDWKGRVWFVSRDNGVVGVIDHRGRGRVLGSRRLGEAIGNSLAVDDGGGVYIVTDEALYRFEATRSGPPRISWRERYRNTGEQKPGQFDRGSGTTPTIMGRKYVSITDNADPMNVVVYRRERRLGRRGGRRGGRRISRVVCEHPVFAKGASATENSLIGTGRSMVVENNYGYFPPPTATESGGTTTPGIWRVDVRRNGRGCRTVWKSAEIAPSPVPKLSLRNGLVYTYTKPAGTPDAWYVTAISFHTGRTMWRKLVGTGLYYNVHYAGLALSPRGDLYTGVLGGTIRLSDG